MKKYLIVPTVLVCMFVSSAAVLAADNQLTDQEKKDGWLLLFNGKDYTGWRCNNGKEIASEVVDGCMQPYKSGGYIVIHEQQFGDFILKCDVKMPKRCNSGIFFRVEHLENPVHTGFEMQVSTGRGTSCHDFGSIYDLVPLRKNMTKGPNAWNSVEIKCQGPKVSVRINGELVCEMDADEFDEPGERATKGDHKYELNGKKRAVKDFARKGYLGLQDHGHPVWYKNVKLLPLEKER
jgi:3-keto-disaccharide hydrolase